MGCTPSKSAVTYSQERVHRDMDTCSTFVSSLKSPVSTPGRPSHQSCVETKQAFLSVPSRDIHGRSVSQPSSSPGAWSASASRTERCSPVPDPRTDTCGTADMRGKEAT